MPRRQAWLATALLALLAGGYALAQQPPTPPAQPPPTAGDDASASPPDAAATDEPATDATADAPRKPAAAKGSPQRFEPTEKVRPDFDVAFPIDI